MDNSMPTDSTKPPCCSSWCRSRAVRFSSHGAHPVIDFPTLATRTLVRPRQTRNSHRHRTHTRALFTPSLFFIFLSPLTYSSLHSPLFLPSSLTNTHHEHPLQEGSGPHGLQGNGRFYSHALIRCFDAPLDGRRHGPRLPPPTRGSGHHPPQQHRYPQAPVPGTFERTLEIYKECKARERKKKK